MVSSQHRSLPDPARLADRQARNWEIAQSQRFDAPLKEPEKVFPFVTISRPVAAGGAELADQLGQRLHWAVYDRELLHEMAGDDRLRESMYRTMDERDLGWVEEACRSLVESKLHVNDYFHRLTETVLCLSRRGSAVFLGRACDLILPRDCGLRVRLAVSAERRLRNFLETHEVRPRQARRELDQMERERAEFIRHHFHTDPDDASRYDLILNGETFDAGQMVELIVAAMRLRGVVVKS